MRLSDFAPRVNNVRVPIPSGIGDASCPSGYVLYAPTNTCTQTPAYRLEKTLSDYLRAAQLGQYGNITPDQFYAMVSQEAANMCADSFISCDGSEQAMADAVARQYVIIYANAVASQAPPDTSNPNALDTNAPSGPSITAHVTLNKAQYLVGDPFQLVITGPPNQPVTVFASQNGVNRPQTQMGTTDGSGRFTISGTMTVESVGNWVEGWYVGNSPAGNITFTVATSALQPPVPKPPVTSDQVLNNQTQGGSQSTANGTSGSNTGASTGAFDWLTKPISDTIPIPLWAALAGGVVALMAMKD